MVDWGAIAVNGFPGLKLMAFDVRKLKTNILVGLRYASPNLHLMHKISCVNPIGSQIKLNFSSFLQLHCKAGSIMWLNKLITADLG
ncbi:MULTISPECIES: hypothetical protein [unclassified Anabaena]|uniref:hypothetical protein n=1 Tax=unclassified Anabaena TaxID=2619674 RepID=UPI00082AF665|nr:MULTISPECIES: hypothetical protein [unclassified Anabaena]